MAIKKETPQVNAGSMADIAFLLLIFFLVTTTIETDKGISQKLPPSSETVTFKEKNIFRVNLNAGNELLVEDELVKIEDPKEQAIAFLDNGGAAKGQRYCDYCKGERVKTSSDNPQIAVISLSNDRETNYGVYVAVQNELVKAYNELRNREAIRLYNITYTNLMLAYDDSKLSSIEKQKVKQQIETIRDLFPKKISEAEINSNL